VERSKENLESPNVSERNPRKDRSAVAKKLGRTAISSGRGRNQDRTETVKQLGRSAMRDPQRNR